MSDGWTEPWLFPLPWPPLADQATQIALRPWGAGEGDAAALAEAWADLTPPLMRASFEQLPGLFAAATVREIAEHSIGITATGNEIRMNCC